MERSELEKLKENLKIKNELLKLGIGCPIVGPTGPKDAVGEKGAQGPTGPTGPILSSSTEGIFFASFEDINYSDVMNLKDTWLVPNPSNYFFVNDNDIEVTPGIYEITFSGLIEQADEQHGATFYLQTKDGLAIKELTYKLSVGDGKQMHFSQTILFRFENITTLQAINSILGDVNTSNVIVSNVTLVMKKLHE